MGGLRAPQESSTRIEARIILGKPRRPSGCLPNQTDVLDSLLGCDEFVRVCYRRFDIEALVLVLDATIMNLDGERTHSTSGAILEVEPQVVLYLASFLYSVAKWLYDIDHGVL
jgi:hypothetical protein